LRNLPSVTGRCVAALPGSIGAAPLRSWRHSPIPGIVLDAAPSEAPQSKMDFDEWPIVLRGSAQLIVAGPAREGCLGILIGGNRELDRSRRLCSRHAHPHMVPSRFLDDLSIVEGSPVAGSVDQPGLLVARIPACFPFGGRGPIAGLRESIRGDEGRCSKNAQGRKTHVGAHVVSIGSLHE
jgi:hypothetical protein